MRLVTKMTPDAFVINDAVRELQPPVNDLENIAQQLQNGEFLYAYCTLRGGDTQIVLVASASEWHSIQARVQVTRQVGDITGLSWYAVKRGVHEHYTTTSS
jgi:hypothetical protein